MMQWNGDKIMFAAMSIALGVISYQLLSNTPRRYRDQPAFAESNYRDEDTSSDRVTRDLDQILSHGVNPFALPPEVTAAEVIKEDDHGENTTQTTQNDPVSGDRPPFPPPDDPTTNTGNETTSSGPEKPAKYVWPVGFGGITQIGSTRFVHIKTEDGTNIMAYEGDTLELLNEDGEPEKVTIVHIYSDRVRVRNEKNQETDLSFDRLKFKGKVFPNEEENPYDVTDEEVLMDELKK